MTSNSKSSRRNRDRKAPRKSYFTRGAIIGLVAGAISVGSLVALTAKNTDWLVPKQSIGIYDGDFNGDGIKDIFVEYSLEGWFPQWKGRAYISNKVGSNVTHIPTEVEKDSELYRIIIGKRQRNSFPGRGPFRTL